MARDAAATRQRIVDAATEEFAAHGIAGARVDEIAARAGINKRMLYYYFGSKEELFREILSRKLAERVATAVEMGDLPRSERVALRQADHLADPEYLRLLIWEALEDRSRRETEGGEVAAEDERREAYQAWVEVTREAIGRGELPDDLDPAQLVLSEIALTMFPVAFPQITRLICGVGPDDPTFLANRQEFLRNLFGHLSPQAATELSD